LDGVVRGPAELALLTNEGAKSTFSVIDPECCDLSTRADPYVEKDQPTGPHGCLESLVGQDGVKRIRLYRDNTIAFE
jgi:hypothetical protein